MFECFYSGCTGENVEIVKDKDGVFKSLKIVVTGKDGKL